MIPKVIHQIWSNLEGPLPSHFKMIGETWKYDYPKWDYRLWDAEKMNEFVRKNYPQYWDMYNEFPYNIQRWDIIRYLILFKIGGLYADFDYESIRAMDSLFKGKTCCFSQEPFGHYRKAKKNGEPYFWFNNALMLSVPKHPFFQKIIEIIFTEENIYKKGMDKVQTVFHTTGPGILAQVYNSLSEKEKEQLYFIPPKYVSPFDFLESRSFRNGYVNDDFGKRVQQAYAIHYFLGTWIP